VGGSTYSPCEFKVKEGDLMAEATDAH
jgi:hypothetical protein